MIKIVDVKIDDELNVVTTFEITAEPYVDPKLLCRNYHEYGTQEEELAKLDALLKEE